MRPQHSCLRLSGRKSWHDLAYVPRHYRRVSGERYGHGHKLTYDPFSPVLGPSKVLQVKGSGAWTGELFKRVVNGQCGEPPLFPPRALFKLRCQLANAHVQFGHDITVNANTGPSIP